MERRRLLITRRLTEAVEARARRDYDVVLNEDDHVMSAAELKQALTDVDAALICITEKFDADLIAALPERFEVVSTFSVGTDHIDLEAARARAASRSMWSVPTENVETTSKRSGSAAMRSASNFSVMQMSAASTSVSACLSSAALMTWSSSLSTTS